MTNSEATGGTELGKPRDGDAYVQSLRAPVKEVARALLDLVRKTAPKLEEKIKYGFPHYDLGGTVVYVMAASDHVDLGFYDGIDLSDPRNLLEGTGKRLRHVKVRSIAEARNPSLRTLIRDSIKIRGPANQRIRKKRS